MVAVLRRTDQIMLELNVINAAMFLFVKLNQQASDFRKLFMQIGYSSILNMHAE